MIYFLKALSDSTRRMVAFCTSFDDACNEMIVMFTIIWILDVKGKSVLPHICRLRYEIDLPVWGVALRQIMRWSLLFSRSMSSHLLSFSKAGPVTALCVTPIGWTAWSAWPKYSRGLPHDARKPLHPAGHGWVSFSARSFSEPSLRSCLSGCVAHCDMLAGIARLTPSSWGCETAALQEAVRLSFGMKLHPALHPPRTSRIGG